MWAFTCDLTSLSLPSLLASLSSMLSQLSSPMTLLFVSFFFVTWQYCLIITIRNQLLLSPGHKSCWVHAPPRHNRRCCRSLSWSAVKGFSNPSAPSVTWSRYTEWAPGLVIDSDNGQLEAITTQLRSCLLFVSRTFPHKMASSFYDSWLSIKRSIMTNETFIRNHLLHLFSPLYLHLSKYLIAPQSSLSHLHDWYQHLYIKTTSRKSLQ